jgi:flagellar biosynthesis protein FlhB
MAEHAGEKTEQASPKRLEEAIKRGQFPRSAEVQTLFVLMFGVMGIKFAGPEIWKSFSGAQFAILGHLHETPLSANLMQGYAITGALALAVAAGPVVLATMIGGLLAGGIQSRFQTASEALEPKWEKLNPIEGFKKIFSIRAAMPTALAIVKLGVIGALTYSQVQQIISDPIFFTSVGVARIAEFMAESATQIIVRIGLAILILAACDYTYQFWQTTRDLMMTKEEVKEELKNTEGNPQIKAAQRRRRRNKSQRQMLLDVPKADVIVTNPTHIAVALQYDRKTMKAPRIVAKGTRLNALKIREIAGKHQIPIIENKPLARMMFKYGKVGGEVPAQLYAAVAEILAYVYRVNRYRYYAQANQN